MSDEAMGVVAVAMLIVGLVGGFVIGDFWGRGQVRWEQCTAVCAPTEGAVREGKCFCLTAREGK